MDRPAASIVGKILKLPEIPETDIILTIIILQKMPKQISDHKCIKCHQLSVAKMVKNFLKAGHCAKGRISSMLSPLVWGGVVWCAA